jgi:hypothetical protein
VRRFTMLVKGSPDFQWSYTILRVSFSKNYLRQFLETTALFTLSVRNDSPEYSSGYELSSTFPPLVQGTTTISRPSLCNDPSHHLAPAYTYICTTSLWPSDAKSVKKKCAVFLYYSHLPAWLQPFWKEATRIISCMHPSILVPENKLRKSY